MMEGRKERPGDLEKTALCCSCPQWLVLDVRCPSFLLSVLCRLVSRSFKSLQIPSVKISKAGLNEELMRSDLLTRGALK
jgi:hypothetical protein